MVSPVVSPVPSPAAPTAPTAPASGAVPHRLSRRSTVGAVLAAYVAEQVEAIAALESEIRAEEPDAVHRLRVAIRRLRSAFATFRPVLDRQRIREVAADLKWLGGVLGHARDQEVLQARVEARLADTEPEQVLGPVAIRLTERFARDHSDARTGYLEALESSRYHALLDALHGLDADLPLTRKASKRATAFLPGAVGNAYGDLRRAVEVAEHTDLGPGRDRALHAARKKAKRARYAAEAAEPVLGKSARRLAKKIKKVQGLLGEHQDSVVARQFLRELGASGHLVGCNGFTYGLWYAEERQAARDAETALRPAWRKASKGRYHRWTGV